MCRLGRPTDNQADLMTNPGKDTAVMVRHGNSLELHRALFREVDGKQIETPAVSAKLIWSTGAVGMALWEGVSLCNLRLGSLYVRLASASG